MQTLASLSSRTFRCLFPLALGALASLAGCSPGKPTVWVYTSLYKEVLAELQPELDRTFPDFRVEFFQGGSEVVAAKVGAEMAGGRTQADVILTSDPFWYAELKQAGKLLPYVPQAASAIPAAFKDPDGAYATNRIPLMVIGFNPAKAAGLPRPARWSDLASPALHGKVTLGSPLESGTTFTAVAFLSESPGWSFFESLRKQEAISAGGNSAVIQRMETGERPVGIVLLENILAARAQKQSPVEAIYPEDGVIPIPSPIAILASTREADRAKKVVDWFFSDFAQRRIIASGMASPLPGMPMPEGAPSWESLAGRMKAWSPEVLARIVAARASIKDRYTSVMLK